MLEKLSGIFSILETVAFEEWKDASEERRLEITKKIGEIEGRMILDEIEKECIKRA
jgi:hypothetical protein